MHFRGFLAVLALVMCFAGISFGAAMTQPSEVVAMNQTSEYDLDIVEQDQTSEYDLDTADQTSEKSLEIFKPKRKKFKVYVWYSDYIGMHCKKLSNTGWFASSFWRHHISLKSKPNDCENTRWSDHKIKSFQWNFYPFSEKFKKGELEKWGDCYLTVWSKKDCKGEVVQRLDKINHWETYRNEGSCNRVRDSDKPGRSVSLMCKYPS